jgi:hypothetical protein
MAVQFGRDVDRMDLRFPSPNGPLVPTVQLSQEQPITSSRVGRGGVLAPDAVRLLDARGRTAERLTEGMLEWRLAALPVEIDAA